MEVGVLTLQGKDNYSTIIIARLFYLALVNRNVHSTTIGSHALLPLFCLYDCGSLLQVGRIS